MKITQKIPLEVFSREVRHTITVAFSHAPLSFVNIKKTKRLSDKATITVAGTSKGCRGEVYVHVTVEGLSYDFLWCEAGASVWHGVLALCTELVLVSIVRHVITFRSNILSELFSGSDRLS